MALRRLLSSAAPQASRCLVVGETGSAALGSAIRAGAKCAGGGSVDVLLTAASKEGAATVARWEHVKNVIVAPVPGALAEAIAPAVVAQVRQKGYGFVVAPATSSGKDVLPRVAGMLDVSPVSDVTGVLEGEGEGGEADTFVRPIYAGNAIATVRSSDAVKVVTVRATAFEAVGEGKAGGDAAVEDVDTEEWVGGNTKSAWVGEEKSVSERPELGSARVVVSGGRGMRGPEGYELVQKLADRLGGAVGATRAAVDNGIAPNELQVGQTGKIVAPELYVAVGLSGAIQHLAGMKDSGTIVAINKDAEAPIFSVADYGLVADMFEALPEIEKKLDDAGIGST